MDVVQPFTISPIKLTCLTFQDITTYLSSAALSYNTEIAHDTVLENENINVNNILTTNNFPISTNILGSLNSNDINYDEPKTTFSKEQLPNPSTAVEIMENLNNSIVEDVQVDDNRNNDNDDENDIQLVYVKPGSGSITAVTTSNTNNFVPDDSNNNDDTNFDTYLLPLVSDNTYQYSPNYVMEDEMVEARISPTPSPPNTKTVAGGNESIDSDIVILEEKDDNIQHTTPDMVTITSVTIESSNTAPNDNSSSIDDTNNSDINLNKKIGDKHIGNDHKDEILALSNYRIGVSNKMNINTPTADKIPISMPNNTLIIDKAKDLALSSHLTLQETNESNNNNSNNQDISDSLNINANSPIIEAKNNVSVRSPPQHEQQTLPVDLTKSHVFELLNSLSSLIGANGEIKDENAIPQIYELMKISGSKIVHQCIVLHILLATKDKCLLEKFLQYGDTWNILNAWLKFARINGYYVYMCNLLVVFTRLPLTLLQLKGNDTARIIKQLSKGTFNMGNINTASKPADNQNFSQEKAPSIIATAPIQTSDCATTVKIDNLTHTTSNSSTETTESNLSNNRKVTTSLATKSDQTQKTGNDDNTTADHQSSAPSSPLPPIILQYQDQIQSLASHLVTRWMNLINDSKTLEKSQQKNSTSSTTIRKIAQTNIKEVNSKNLSSTSSNEHKINQMPNNKNDQPHNTEGKSTAFVSKLQQRLEVATNMAQHKKRRHTTKQFPAKFRPTGFEQDANNLASTIIITSTNVTTINPTFLSTTLTLTHSSTTKRTTSTSSLTSHSSIDKDSTTLTLPIFKESSGFMDALFESSNPSTAALISPSIAPISSVTMATLKPRDRHHSLGSGGVTTLSSVNMATPPSTANHPHNVVGKITTTTAVVVTPLSEQLTPRMTLRSRSLSEPNSQSTQKLQNQTITADNMVTSSHPNITGIMDTTTADESEGSVFTQNVSANTLQQEPLLEGVNNPETKSDDNIQTADNNDRHQIKERVIPEKFAPNDNIGENGDLLNNTEPILDSFTTESTASSSFLDKPLRSILSRGGKSSGNSSIKSQKNALDSGEKSSGKISSNYRVRFKADNQLDQTYYFELDENERGYCFGDLSLTSATYHQKQMDELSSASKTGQMNMPSVLPTLLDYMSPKNASCDKSDDNNLEHTNSDDNLINDVNDDGEIGHEDENLTVGPHGQFVRRMRNEIALERKAFDIMKQRRRHKMSDEVTKLNATFPMTTWRRPALLTGFSALLPNPGFQSREKNVIQFKTTLPLTSFGEESNTVGGARLPTIIPLNDENPSNVMDYRTYQLPSRKKKTSDFNQYASDASAKRIKDASGITPYYKNHHHPNITTSISVNPPIITQNVSSFTDASRVVDSSNPFAQDVINTMTKNSMNSSEKELQQKRDTLIMNQTQSNQSPFFNNIPSNFSNNNSMVFNSFNNNNNNNMAANIMHNSAINMYGGNRSSLVMNNNTINNHHLNTPNLIPGNNMVPTMFNNTMRNPNPMTGQLNPTTNFMMMNAANLLANKHHPMATSMRFPNPLVQNSLASMQSSMLNTGYRNQIPMRPYKNVQICKHFKAGSCRLGDKCGFSHQNK